MRITFPVLVRDACLFPATCVCVYKCRLLECWVSSGKYSSSVKCTNGGHGGTSAAQYTSNRQLIAPDSRFLVRLEQRMVPSSSLACFRLHRRPALQKLSVLINRDFTGLQSNSRRAESSEQQQTLTDPGKVQLTGPRLAYAAFYPVLSSNVPCATRVK